MSEQTRPHPDDWYCNAPNPKRQKICSNRAGYRTPHVGVGQCYLHGGNRPTNVQHAEPLMRQKAIIDAAHKFGIPIKTDPEQALLDSVAEAAGLVAYYRQRVDELIDEHDRNAQGDDKKMASVVWQQRIGTSTGAGMLGPKLELDRFGREHVVGEDLRAFARLYNQERDRLVKYSAAAISAGIAKRQVELAQRTGDSLVMVIVAVFTRLGLDEQIVAQARRLIAEEFRALADRERHEQTVVEGRAVVVR